MYNVISAVMILLLTIYSVCGLLLGMNIDIKRRFKKEYYDHAGFLKLGSKFFWMLFWPLLRKKMVEEE